MAAIYIEAPGQYITRSGVPVTLAQDATTGRWFGFIVAIRHEWRNGGVCLTAGTDFDIVARSPRHGALTIELRPGEIVSLIDGSPEAEAMCRQLGRLRIAAKLLWPGSPPGPRDGPVYSPVSRQLTDPPCVVVRCVLDGLWETVVAGESLYRVLMTALLNEAHRREEPGQAGCIDWSYFSIGLSTDEQRCGVCSAERPADDFDMCDYCHKPVCLECRDVVVVDDNKTICRACMGE